MTAEDRTAGHAFTAPCRIDHTAGGDRYTFFCGLSGKAVYTTAPIRERDPQRAAAAARGQARPHFNRCSQCGKWVCDTAYNIDEMKCVACAPCAAGREETGFPGRSVGKKE